NEVTGEVADRIWEQLAAFASYGFPESHSVSFAYLVYVSAWLKRYYPAAFCAGLLDAQPMGFYSPHTLVQDARRHGVEVRTPDVNASGVGATLEHPEGPDVPAGPGADDRPGEPGRLWGVPLPPAPPEGAAPAGTPPEEWGRGGPAVRLGLSSVRAVGDELARRIVAEREAR